MTVKYSIPFQLYRSINGLIFHTCSGLLFLFLYSRKSILKASIVKILWINCGILLSQPTCYMLNPLFYYFLTHNT